MPSTVDQFLEILCPSLYNSDSKAIYVEIATASTGESFFGFQYSYAVALRAAHDYTIDKTRADGAGGMVTNKTEGRTSISYWNAIPKGDSSNLSATTYGQRLKALIRSIGSGISIGAPDVL